MAYKKTLTALLITWIALLLASNYYYVINDNTLLGKALGDFTVTLLFPIGFVLLLEYSERQRRSPKNNKKISKLWPVVMAIIFVLLFLTSGIMQEIARSWLPVVKKGAYSIAIESSLIANSSLAKFALLLFSNILQMLIMLLLPLLVATAGAKLVYFLRNRAKTTEPLANS